MSHTRYELILLAQSLPVNSEAFWHLLRESQRALRIIKAELTSKNDDTQMRIVELEGITSLCMKIVNKEDHICKEPINIKHIKKNFNKQLCTNCLNLYWNTYAKLTTAMRNVPLYRVLNHPNCHAIHILKSNKNKNYDPETTSVNVPNPRTIGDLDEL